MADPEAVRLWQRDLCESPGICGRILISAQGLNGTIGGELTALKRYVRKTRDYPAFSQIDFKPTKNMLNRREISCREQLVVCPACAGRDAPVCAVHVAQPR